MNRPDIEAMEAEMAKDGFLSYENRKALFAYVRELEAEVKLHRKLNAPFPAAARFGGEDL